MALWSGITKAAGAFLPWRRRKDDLGWAPLWAGTSRPWFGGTADDEIDLGQARWLSATSRCIALLSDAISASPQYVVRAVEGGGRVPVTATDASRVVSLMSFHDRECLMVSLLSDGNAYGRLRRNDRNGVTAIEPLQPWRVGVATDDDGSLWYKIAEDTTLRQAAEILPSSEVLHIRLRPTSTSHFVLGVSPLASACRSLETVLRVAERGRTYYSNASLPSFLLSTDLILTPEQVAQLRERWDSTAKGEGLGGVPILTAGLKGSPIPRQSAVEQQLQEMSKLSVSEIGRCYGVPNSFLNETSSTNFATASEMARALVSTTLAPLATRVADAMSQALLSRDERMAGMSVAIDLSDLVIGQGVERAEYASKLANAGLASPNEIRDLLSYPDVTEGDELRVPVNTVPLSTWAKGEPKPLAMPGVPAPAPRSSARIRALRRALA